ncbi:hypothetical protein WJX72_008296 [[Myrmecia] bisecta]|uniref:Uncharacterized protein n=1 Tax=[Myrmecia] bisecta TaxID=41462 RepID=A0AAW1PP72_9CHLO
MSSYTIQLLHQLSYTSAQTINLANVADFRRLISWLEETQVPRLRPAQQHVMQDFDSPDWDTVFAQYLTALDCPIKPAGPTELGDTLDWLLLVAVSHTHGTSAAMQPIGEPSAPAETAKDGPSTSAPAQHCFSDWHADETQRALASLLDRLHVARGQGDLTQQLQAAVQRVEHQVLPAASELGFVKRQRTNASTSHVLDPGVYPSGLDTGDGLLNEAVRLLRMRYVMDLRELAAQIDGVTQRLSEHASAR